MLLKRKKLLEPRIWGRKKGPVPTNTNPDNLKKGCTLLVQADLGTTRNKKEALLGKLL